MNLKLKRLVRTSSSEQYAVFDLDQTDEDDQLPLTIGKLDLHYTGEGVYGTMLLWDDASRELRPAYRRAFIQVLLEDIIQPMGVPNEYVIEFFAPDLDLYEVFHNVDLDDELDSDTLDYDEPEYYDEPDELEPELSGVDVLDADSAGSSSDSDSFGEMEDGDTDNQRRRPNA